MQIFTSTGGTHLTKLSVIVQNLKISLKSVAATPWNTSKKFNFRNYAPLDHIFQVKYSKLYARAKID